jgi:hypothetical protein
VSSSTATLRFIIDNGTGLSWEENPDLTPSEYSTIMANAYADYQATHVASGDPRPFNDDLAWYYVCKNLKTYLLTP